MNRWVESKYVVSLPSLFSLHSRNKARFFQIVVVSEKPKLSPSRPCFAVLRISTLVEYVRATRAEDDAHQ